MSRYYRSGRGLGDFTPNNTLLSQLQSFANSVNNHNRQQSLATFQQEEGQWAQYINTLRGYLPLLTQYRNHATLGTQATALLSQVTTEEARAGAQLNSVASNVNYYGGRARYQWVSGVGIKNL